MLSQPSHTVPSKLLLIMILDFYYLLLHSLSDRFPWTKGRNGDRISLTASTRILEDDGLRRDLKWTERQCFLLCLRPQGKCIKLKSVDHRTLEPGPSELKGLRVINNVFLPQHGLRLRDRRREVDRVKVQSTTARGIMSEPLKNTC